MAFEYLDLENKLYIPMQQLITQIQLDLVSFYTSIRQTSIDVHNSLATLGKELYDSPVETLTLWFNQASGYGTELYAVFAEQLKPLAETSYEEMLTSASDYAVKIRDTVGYVTENPEQVTAEAIASMTSTRTAAGNVSAEIVALLLEQPLQTLEPAYMELLSSLLNGYFELVSTLLASLRAYFGRSN